MKRISIGVAAAIIALLVNTVLADRGWGIVLRTAICFCIGVVAMLGYRWAER